MKHGKHIQVSESFLLCALLTMTGGFLDVYTYITRGHVFANAQTGNVVLLGLNLAEGNIKEVAFYLFPIIAFALGILFTEWIRAKFKEYDLLHWRQIVVFFEALLLFFPAFMASGMWDTAVNILVSFVCAVQVESFRKVNGHSVATTMCTGNLSAHETPIQRKPSSATTKSSSFSRSARHWEPPCPPSSLKKPFCSAASFSS